MSPREKGRASIWIISSCLLGDFYTIKRIHSFTPGFIDGKTWILKCKHMKIEDFFSINQNLRDWEHHCKYFENLWIVIKMSDFWKINSLHFSLSKILIINILKYNTPWSFVLRIFSCFSLTRFKKLKPMIRFSHIKTEGVTMFVSRIK